ncbi:hypothetical protein [Psychroflexus aestuariivivens]|uniref:hypothetical protein n=1 Tax=Psychroflexus aestuariivivens TaxID=1795040 RepID=UPI001F025F4A|nr:hypothetical protein [Psychroflexus aestuariivivens]
MKHLLLILIAVVICQSCDFDKSEKQGESVNFIPPKSLLILESEDLSESLTSFQNNDFFKANLDLPVFQDLKENFEFLKHFNQTSRAILAITPLGERDLASTLIIENNAFQMDSVQLSRGQIIEYAGKEITEFNIEKQQFYSTVLEQIRVTSESKIIVENVIRSYNNQFKFNESFYKAYKAATGETSLFIDLENTKRLWENDLKDFSPVVFKDLGSWLSLDLDLDPDELRWSGVILSEASRDKLKLFSNNKPKPYRIHEVTPNSAVGFLSLSFSDFEKLQEKRQELKYSTDIKFNNLFQSVNEVGLIQLESDLVYDLVSRSSTKILDSLRGFSEEVAEFRNEKIYKFDPENIFADFTPLLPNYKLSYFTLYDGHFLFAQSQDILENALINIKNGSVMSQSVAFQNTAEELGNTANMFWGGNTTHFMTQLSKFSTSEFNENFQKFEKEKYDVVLMQATFEGDFSHFNGLAKKNSENTTTNSIETKRLKFDKSLSSAPIFFTNWRTRQKDIVFQDENNVLHLVDTNGKSIWTKELDSRIVGEILSLDIYKNTRIQLAFTTQNRLYVLDKNGNDVKPFPLKFQNIITQGLAIFDYDDSGRYRFVVVQDDDIKMFNKEGKSVKGFNYKIQGQIKHTPKHIRIDRKDYILVENESGLKILNRTGEPRVKIKKDLKTSGNSWHLHNGHFVGTDSDGNLIKISEDGQVEVEEMGFVENHIITATPENLVTFSENTIDINGISKSLDYGLYLPPKLHQFNNNRTFVSLVDQQAEKVYLFDNQGELISGFPVYGTSEVDVFMRKTNELILVTKGNDDAVLVYRKTL